MIRLLLLACSLHSKVLFQDLPSQKVCVNGLSWAREFAVTKPCTETVRIRHIRGVTREFRGEPRLWLDNRLLGPLRLEFENGGWQSPEPLAFSAGKHSLSIECGAEAFEIEGVVIGEAAAPKKAAAAPAAAVPTQAPAGSLAPLPLTSSCGVLKQNLDWLPGRPSKAIMLSVVNGREIRTPLLSVLRRGEKLRWWFYVHPRPSHDTLRYPPILLEVLKGKDEKWVLAFSIDQQELARASMRKKKDYEPRPLGYREDKWTALDLELCGDGRLNLSLNDGEVRGQFSVAGPDMPLMVQTSQIEFEIKGKKE